MARASTLNVSLTSTLRNYVDAKVRRGGYESASEVVRESLRALQQRDRLQQQFWSDVRKKVAVAKRQTDTGELFDGELAMQEIIDTLSISARPKKKERAS